MTASDKQYMQRALELAQLGSGNVAPNPMVGCVVVHREQVIGEGWHQQFGGPHAEVNAINAVSDKNLLSESRVYVTLEPCSHYGKTPPCADFLLANGVRDVVICNTDPNPLVAGNGIRKLMEAGCQVKVGVLEEQGLELNKRFFTFQEKKRPYIILKWAETADGFIAKPEYKQEQISSALAKKLVHKWRTEEQAIMVGHRTALHDNPRLDAREWSGKNPVRIIIDKNLTLPPHLHIFNQNQPTIVYNAVKTAEAENLIHVKLQEDENLLPQLLQDLHQRNIQSVLVEGGTVLLEHFIKSGIWDEARIFRSKKIFGEGIKAPAIGFAQLQQVQQLGEDQLLVFATVFKP
ncbi:MAG: bifunctional diaminohydroxyphosphoribosylaminopyrimidine deaminase/5-amino-6-(5-phosphoribosylamino)uracil reductase RibD [Hymenobacteraceae bacterium]|nr:bifunctional diaminohydroxyphosphoribosylaminopyrimidine deaminase/5-amino-6-(5-phosphoribosylamino)uracil reductase RibD [Hymenobacteraceae bacterium]MDX5397627.1 bifunctional diaminohydroxyphosphoribosylaminopyrimidine deaminase/5-amino-6-(5-phosphoribosylamino)uracil reductase RibD [Hymenobacteraceae bacterium]MDX5443167.1 bifunctional diaminohydroxyphosphoribosylaminopyrimidine deaminase/5-amino-6-(5-phosphoribosylamino)uracil reductase RibD [Hymenobacteraceae bacterium]MDX5513704.1 bifun